MNWRELVWRIAIRLAGYPPMRVNVRTKVSIRDESLPPPDWDAIRRLAP